MNLGLTCAALLALTQTLPPVEPPPMPDFKEPVDFVAWYKQQMEFAKGSNALDMYGTFLFAEGDAQPAPIAPAPGSPAAGQLRALLDAPTPWNPAIVKHLGQWVQETETRYRSAFEAASQRRYFAIPVYPDLKFLSEVHQPMYANGRAIGQMMFARAWRATEKKLYTDYFVDAVRTNLIFANMMGYGLSLEEQFFAAGHRTFVYDQIQRTYPSPAHDAAVFNKVLDVLRKHDDIQVTKYFARSLYFSEAAALQLLQHFCTEVDESGKSQLSPTIKSSAVEEFVEQHKDRWRFRQPNVKSFSELDPGQLAQTVHAYFQAMREVLDAPQAPDINEKLRRIETQKLQEHPELNVLITPIGLAVQTTFRTEAQRRMTRLFLRMAVQFKETAKWPQTLEEITGPDLGVLRVDPFTGKDFALKRIGSHTAIYSYGANGVDDGGDTTKDIVYWANVTPDLDTLKIIYGKEGDQKKEGAATQPATTQPADATPPTTQPAASPTSDK